MVFIQLYLLFGLPLILASFSRSSDLTDKINMYIGTSYWRNISDNHDYGNTMLNVGVPFAHTPWSAQTRSSENKCDSTYYFFDSNWQGMRRTHWMTGSCVIDYGTASVLPSLTLNLYDALHYHALDHNNEISKPFYYSMYLAESDIDVEVTSKNSAGIFRSKKRPPQRQQAGDEAANFYYLLFLPSDTMYNQSSVEFLESSPGGGMDVVNLHSPVHRWYQSQREYANFDGHHHFRTSRPALEFGVIHGYLAGGDAAGSNVEAGATAGQSDSHGPAVAYMKFDARDGAVSVATACSFLSADNAEYNMRAELLDQSIFSVSSTSTPTASSAKSGTNSDDKLFDLEAVAKSVRDEWNAQLASIEVGPPVNSASKTAQEEFHNNSVIFYTALWHSLLLPRVISDADGAYLSFTDRARTVQNTHPPAAVPQELSPSTATVKENAPRNGNKEQQRKNDGGAIKFGDYYDDFSMWDIFRSQVPLLHLLQPTSTIRDMVASLVVKAQQGHWMPIFPAWNSYTGEMVGDHCGVWIADAVLKNIVSPQDPIIASSSKSAAASPGMESSVSSSSSSVLHSREQDVDLVDTEQGALYYLLKNALLVPPSEYEYEQSRGRRALDSYLQYGYIPMEDLVLHSPHPLQQVSRTLEYAYDDHVLAQLLQHVRDNNPSVLLRLPWEEILRGLENTGRIDRTHPSLSDKAKPLKDPLKICDYLIELLRTHSGNYQNVIDSAGVGFVRGRHRNGSWAEPDASFDPARYYKWLTETNAWQYTWFVPHAVERLVWLYGGDLAFAEKLNAFFEEGWYNHGNEPDHHAAYLAAYVRNEPSVNSSVVGGAWQVQQRVSEIIRTQYAASQPGLPGNEDAGQMSAWLVMSAVGIFQVCPGCGAPHPAAGAGPGGAGGEYVIGVPLFDSMTVYLPQRLAPSSSPFSAAAEHTRGSTGEHTEESTLRINVHNRADPIVDIYIQQMFINGVPNDCAFVSHRTVVVGGKWEFYMGSRPNVTWGAHGHHCIV